MLNKRFFVLFLGIALILTITHAVSATIQPACGTISSSGYWELNQTVNSTTTCLTIAASNVELDCKGNTILYNTGGGATNFGINVIYLLTPLENITIKNCAINDPTVGGTPSAGIQFTRVTDSYILNNTIQTNGTLTNNGITLTTGCKRNRIVNNTIDTFGSSNGNYGIYLTSEVSNNNITGNTITGTGNTTSYAIYLAADANSNLIQNNSLSTISTVAAGNNSDPHVVVISSSNYNNITENYIYSQGVQRSYAVYILTNADTNIISRNNIYVNLTAGATAYGVYSVYSPRTEILENNITLNGTGTLHGVYLTNSPHAQVKNCTVLVSRAGASTFSGVTISAASKNTTIQDNYISLTGTGAMNGFSVTSSDVVTIQNNQVILTGTGGTINGVSSTTSYGSSIKSNNITISGTTLLNGVVTTVSPNNYIENNYINIRGTGATNVGVSLISSTSSTIINNSVYSSASTPAYGVYLYRNAAGNTIEGNNLSTYGTTNANVGVLLSTGCNFNTIRSNNVNTNGGGTTNYGMQLTTSDHNLIEANNITTNGTTSNHGIYILTQGGQNTVKDNNISVYGTLTSTGVYINSANYNKIIGNTIVANGSNQTVPVATSNYGINIIASSYFTEVYNNSITTGGVGSNFGIYTNTNSRWGIFIGNDIHSGGNGANNHGLFISESHYGIFENNSISTTGSATDYGVYLQSSATENTLKGNNISTIGSTTSHAFGLLYIAAGGYPENNYIQNNNLVSIAGRDLNFENASINGTSLINQIINNYSFTGNSGSLIIENTSAGKIIFNAGLLSGSNTTFSDRIFINNNFARIDEYTDLLNKSANITLYNIPTASTELYIARNGVPCENICTNLTSLQAGNVTFNVTGGGNYSILSNTAVPSLVLNSPENTFNTSAQRINFNFTASDDVSLTLNCSIYLDSILNRTNESTIAGQLTNFLIDGLTEGAHQWHIECFDEGYNVNISETRTVYINVTSPSVALDYPSDESYLNNVSYVQLNYTAYDNNNLNMTVWLYGDNILLRTSENIENATALSYTWEGLDLGEHNWTVITNNGFSNSSNTYYYFNLVNLTINCEAGGPYLDNPTVLIQGAISDNSGLILLSSKSINISIYNSTNYLSSFTNVTTESNGIFNSMFTGLDVDNYTAYTTVSYQGIVINDSTPFRISLGYADGYNVGFAIGNSSGYISGFNEGNITGFNLGNISGFAIGNSSGFNLGNASGFVAGYSLGNTTGYVLGNESGYVLGNATGFTLGNVSGFILGNASGFVAGNISGFNLGNATGFSLGNLSGFILGNLTGFNLGNASGYAEGYNVGFAIGNSSGYISGFNDGNITGFNLGNISGFILGNVSGYVLGNATGFVEGYSLGNTTGYILGNESGYVLGNATGFTLGNVSGFILGNTSGFIAGNISGYLEGFNLGNITGFNLGNQTGFILGNLSGFNLGNQTGYAAGYDAGYNASKSSASFVLDKIASFYNISNTTLTYNITLRLTNKGGSNATNINITDSDYAYSNFTIENLTTGGTITQSYLLNFTRNSTIYYYSTAIAQAYGTDSFLNNLISTNSRSIDLTIPSQEIGQQLTLIKNIVYNNQTSNSVNYTLNVQVVNSGGVDVSDINLQDSDINKSGVNAIILSRLNRTESYSTSGEVIIDKAQSNTEKLFVKSTASVGIINYESNQISVLIPGYGGGPNDVSVDAPTSVLSGNNFEFTIVVKNMNPDIGQDFILSYWLLSNDESTVYSSGSQTLFVAGNGSINSTIIHLLAPVNAGTYKMRANVSGLGVGVQATALSTFVVNVVESTDSSFTGGGGGGGGGGGSGGDNAGEFCLDVNNNSICDKDEILISLNLSENISLVGDSNQSDFDDENVFAFKELVKNSIKFISNYLRSVSNQYSFVFIILLIFIVFILFKIRELSLVEKMVSLFYYLFGNFIYRKINPNLLSNIEGIKVYSSSGSYVGKVEDIYLDEKVHRVDGWLVSVNSDIEKIVGKKLILVKPEFVSSIGEIMVLGVGVDKFIGEESFYSPFFS